MVGFEVGGLRLLGYQPLPSLRGAPSGLHVASIKESSMGVLSPSDFPPFALNCLPSGSSPPFLGQESCLPSGPISPSRGENWLTRALTKHKSRGIRVFISLLDYLSTQMPKEAQQTCLGLVLGLHLCSVTKRALYLVGIYPLLGCPAQ